MKMKGVVENVESIEELEQNENANIIDLWTPCEFVNLRLMQIMSMYQKKIPYFLYVLILYIMVLPIQY